MCLLTLNKNRCKFEKIVSNDSSGGSRFHYQSFITTFLKSPLTLN